MILVGPAPPLRGGIAAHTARLVEALAASGRSADVLSWSRMVPRLLFPGRSPWLDDEAASARGPAPALGEALLDVLDPRTWLRARHRLAAGRGPVVVQWWHPVAAPALLAATAGIAPRRLRVVCHNALPHEAFPAAAAAARRVLGRAGVVLCHSRAEATRVASLLGSRGGPRVEVAPLPCLLPMDLLDAMPGRAEPGEAACGEAAGAATQSTPATRLVLHFGHVRAYKGTSTLVEAWQASRRPPGARLALVGEWYLRGRRARALAGRIAGDPSIVVENRYVGDEELLRWFRSAELLVLPCRTASQSGTLPIAKALGLPCLVSNAGGLAEQVGDAAVVEAGDAASLARALEHHWVAPRARAPRQERAEHSAQWMRVLEGLGLAARP